ncbi:hypothetical protein [Nocardia sp. NPDC003963]
MSTSVLPTNLSTCVAIYRRVHGLDARVTKTWRIVVLTGKVGCIRMPAALGNLVATELQRRGLSTPIIVDTASTSWRFLTQRPTSTPLFDPLFMHGAKQAGFGAEISLPTPRSASRYWEVAPVGTQRLPSETVVDIALAQAGSRVPL